MAFAHAVPDPDDNQIGDLIRQARERAGMTQMALAAAIHAGASSVPSWERGVHTPSADMVLALSAALHVRFVADPELGWRVEEGPAPAGSAPALPQVVVIVASTAEAMNAALDRAGVPRAE